MNPQNGGAARPRHRSLILDGADRHRLDPCGHGKYALDRGLPLVAAHRKVLQLDRPLLACAKLHDLRAQNTPPEKLPSFTLTRRDLQVVDLGCDRLVFPNSALSEYKCDLTRLHRRNDEALVER